MKIKISGAAERDIADGCDFYGDIDPNLATHYSKPLSPTLLFEYV